MALETGTYISDLVVTNPTGSDALAFADDHLRLLKTTIKNTFPNVSGAISKTHTEINTAVDQAAAALPKAGGTMTGPLVLSGDPTVALNPATKQYVDASSAAAVSSAASSAATLYPTKSGTGATGTWPISISGNAATATSATSAGNATTVTNGVYTTNFTGANQSIGTNGFQVLPGGLIVQWGYSPSWSAVTFPRAFSNCFSVVGTPTVNQEFYIASKSNTGFSPGTNGNTGPFYWVAYGN